MEINGERRWGVNEQRDYGCYTAGPHNGYWTRGEAVALLRELRSEEREDRKREKMAV